MAKNAIVKITSRKDLIKALESQGFDCVLARSGHYKIYRGTRLITTSPATPSDTHSLRNCVAILRRNGFVCAR
jgi:predicted RNA binding protein YcfA (HicA-like mRNA interferase family)